MTVKDSNDNDNGKMSGDQNASSTITAIIEKDQDETLGINLAKKGGKIIITAIKEGMPISKTALRVNMEVLTVNNIDVANSSTEEILVILKSTQGTLTIVARQPTLAPGTLITAVITKTDPNESVGIGMGAAPGGTGGGVCITSIKLDSLAYPTDLQAGMIVKSVNNVDCSNKSPTQVANLLGAATGTFPILAQVPLAVAEAQPLLPEQPTTTTNNGSKGGAHQRGAPPGLPEGGTWSKRNYVGNQTLIFFVMGCFCFGIFGPLALCCPCDERDVYTVDGRVYTSDGQMIGTAPTTTGASQGTKKPTAGNGRVK